MSGADYSPAHTRNLTAICPSWGLFSYDRIDRRCRAWLLGTFCLGPLQLTGTSLQDWAPILQNIS